MFRGLPQHPPQGELRLWDAKTTQLRGQPLPFREAVVALAFRADGGTLLAGGLKGTARIVRVDTGEQVGPDMVHEGGLHSVALARDGRLALTGGNGAQLWDVATGQPIGTRRLAGQAVNTVAVREDGRRFLAGGALDVAYSWENPQSEKQPPDRLIKVMEVKTGLQYTSRGDFHVLDAEEWQACRLDLERHGAAPQSPRLSEWHLREAELCERIGYWFGAWWHLWQLPEDALEGGALRVRRARAAVRAGQWEAAESDLSKALKERPEDGELWQQRGRARMERHRWDDALEDLSHAIKLRRDSWEPLALRASVHVQHGRWQEAAEDLNRAGALPGAPLQVYADTAVLCLHQKKPAEYQAACARLLKAAGRSPSAPSAARVAWVCSLGREAVADFAPVLQLAQRAVKADVKDYACARSLGAALYRAGRYKEAAQQLEAAAGLQKGHAPSVWLLLAMASHRMEQKDQAEQWLERAGEWIEQAQQKPSEHGGEATSLWERLPWAEQLALEQFYHEAVALIKGAGIPVKKDPK